MWFPCTPVKCVLLRLTMAAKKKDVGALAALIDGYVSLSRSQQSPVDEEDEKKSAVGDAPNRVGVDTTVAAVGVRPALKDVLGNGAMNSRAFRSALSNAGTSAAGKFKTRMATFYGISSSAGSDVYAAINVYTAATYGLQSLGEFTNFLALFREFRIVEFRFHYIPWSPFKIESGTNSNGRTLVVNVDPMNDSVPTSSLTQYIDSDARLFSNQMVEKWTVRNSDKNWYNTFSTTNPLLPLTAIKIAGDASLGASQNIGVLAINYIVEFRARF